MRFSILTIFPDLLVSPLREGIIRKAQEEGRVDIDIVNIRDFTTDKHATTDDRPYGGGEGMVMKPEPLTAALNHVREKNCPGDQDKVILLSPQGRKFDQAAAEELSKEKHLVMICGRYEGVDERFSERYVDDEISIGDFILTGGELAAMVVLDAVTRLQPGALGCSDSVEKDTFSRGLLKHPQYTRPRNFEGIEIPPVLLTGDHEKISIFRFIASVRRTINRRPDLIKDVAFSPRELKILEKCGFLSEIETLRVDRGPHE